MVKGVKPWLIASGLAVGALAALLTACSSHKAAELNEEQTAGKPVVYQIFTRLFGNTETRNRPWGTIEQNGVGTFADINDNALSALRELGVTHVWYTGVLHHAMVADYSAYGLAQDDPDVVKGRAGSPYAIRDYYDVNPDLAENPAQRLNEFRELIKRSHAHGLKVVIDIVPNHVARRYQSTMKPASVRDFGEDDNTGVEYARDNNFYYVPGKPFELPVFPEHHQPLGGEAHPLVDGYFEEYPAKWTGNGAREAQPDFDDWYETVKINYGVRPDGSHDFPSLPAGYDKQPASVHAAFWQQQDVPDSWKKFNDIVHYWLDFGVDGFRFDMAEMVPVEFWSYLNSSILARKPDAFLLAEIYNPLQYRNYINNGKMGYLYDKVGLYDALRSVMAGEISADAVLEAYEDVLDISDHMLNFLENHDEQRIAHAEFAGAAVRGWPAMVVSATLNKAALMVYFGQEVGEAAEQNMGFGSASRTTIFDYAGVPAHQRWLNNGKYDGALLSANERQLREQYQRLLTLVRSSPVLKGEFYDLHRSNVVLNQGYDERLLSFARWQGEQRWLIVANVEARETRNFTLEIPAELITSWQLTDGAWQLRNLLNPDQQFVLTVVGNKAFVNLTLAAEEALILSF
jgi:glycosidase